MDVKQVMSFIKIEHTLFSLPFILIGYFIAVDQFYGSKEMPIIDLLLVLVAAVGARGLAMTLNRIIDRKIDAANPRTAKRHLATGAMSLATAWSLAIVFLGMLVVSAGLLNQVALMMAWLPVLAFVVYPSPSGSLGYAISGSACVLALRLLVHGSQLLLTFTAGRRSLV